VGGCSPESSSIQWSMVHLGGSVLGNFFDILSSKLYNRLVSSSGIGVPTRLSSSISPITAAQTCEPERHTALFMINAKIIFTSPLGFYVFTGTTHVFISFTITIFPNHGTRTTMFLLRNYCPKMTSKLSIGKTIKFSLPFQSYNCTRLVRKLSLPSFP
jgi:hypothetical protein